MNQKRFKSDVMDDNLMVPITGLPSFLENLIDVIHISGVHWWGSIIIIAISYRVLFFFLYIPQLRNGAVLKLMEPQTARIRKEIKNCKKEKKMEQTRFYQRVLQQHYRNHNVHPIRNFVTIVLTSPLYVSIIMAVRDMVHAYPSFKMGGLLWILDLTAPDPYFILPGICFALIILNTYVATKPFTSSFLHKVIFGIAVGTSFVFLYFAMSLPTAILLIIFSSSVFTFLQTIIFKTNRAKLFFNIPTGDEHRKNAWKIIEDFKKLPLNNLAD